MVRSSEKCIFDGKSREDRSLSEKTVFESLQLEIKYPDSAILLLKTPEKAVLLTAAAALSKFAGKSRKNVETLFDLDIVDTILAIVSNEDLYTRRFALKLLAQMCAISNVCFHLLKTDNYLTMLTQMMISETDVFIIEFASRSIAELTKDIWAANVFLRHYSDVSFVFDKIKWSDPDIKRNCIEIIYNTLKDLFGPMVVTHSQAFSFQSVYELLEQPYPVIQELSLGVLELLIMRNSDNSLQELFRSSGGIERFLDILNDEDRRHIYGLVLKNLKHATENEQSASVMNQSGGTKRLMNFIKNPLNNSLIVSSLRVLVNLARSDEGAKVLESWDFVTLLLEYLHNIDQDGLQPLACIGAARMSKNLDASDKIAEQDFITPARKLLFNTNLSWCDRQIGAMTLIELFASDFRNAKKFVDSIEQKNFIEFVKKSHEELSWEKQAVIVQLMDAIATYPKLVDYLIDEDLFLAIMKLENVNDMKIASCTLLTQLAIDERARKIFMKIKLVKRLFNLIRVIETVQVRMAATQLLLALITDQQFAHLCNLEGFLFYMLDNQSALGVIPNWEICIKTLFDQDLPLKFSYTGRLSLHDITQDGFYALRRCTCPLPILEEIFHTKICPMEPVYVANFSEPEKGRADEYFETHKDAFEEAREFIRRESVARGIRISEPTITAWLEVKFGRLQSDPDLQNYLAEFREELLIVEQNHPESLEPGTVIVSSIARRARLLGRLVARQLSGANSGSCCATIDQQLELHLREIKADLETSVIPLGQLRVGSFLERALLFKVIADQVGLPCGLVRGGSRGRSWIELADPKMDEEQEVKPRKIRVDGDEKSEKSRFTCYSLPKRLFAGVNPNRDDYETYSTEFLRPNFVVNLLDRPGELMPIDSREAKIYCGIDKACRKKQADP